MKMTSKYSCANFHKYNGHWKVLRSAKSTGCRSWISRIGGNLLFLILLFGISSQLQAQSIQFSIYVANTLSATKDQDMDMGEVFSGSGFTGVALGDPGMGVFAITGNEELDIIVTLTTSANLIHTGASADVIPYTLDFAYANKGANDVNQAIVGTGGTARFQMRGRESGPAGAPPTPPSAHHTPTDATVYLYIYGSMNVGAIDPGTYSADVDLSVTYD